MIIGMSRVIYHKKALLVVIRTLKNYEKVVPESRKTGVRFLKFSLISSK